MKQTNVYNVFFIILIFSLSSNLICSQDLLIYEDSRSRSSLTAEEERLFTVFENSQFYESLTLAKFERIDNKQEGGIIKINLPGDDCADLFFRATEVEYKNENDYSWTGDLVPQNGNEDCYCRYGSITIVSSTYGKIAHVQIDDKVFEILELSPESYVIGKLKESKFTADECAINSLSNNISTKIEQGSSPRDVGNCNVRCLVLFTPKAETFEGSVAGVNNRVNLAIRQTNRALRKSDVSSCELTIELAGVMPLNFIESEDMGVDFNKFIDMGDVIGLT